MTKGESCGWQRRTLVNSQRWTVAIGQGSFLRFGRRFRSPSLCLSIVLTTNSPLLGLAVVSVTTGPPFLFGCRFRCKGSPFGLAVLSSQRVPLWGLAILSDKGGTLVNGQERTLWTAKGDPCEQPNGGHCNRSRVLPWVWLSFPSQQFPPCV